MDLPPPSGWLVTNAGVLISAVGTIIAAGMSSLAAYVGYKNREKLVEIHVSTDGRLTEMAKDVADTRVAAELAAREARDAVITASAKAVQDVADAQAATAERLMTAPAPAAVVAGTKFEGTIEGKVEKGGVLKADTIGVIK